MVDALLGGLAVAVVFTFFPTLGLRISNGLKAGVEWFRGKAS